MLKRSKRWTRPEVIELLDTVWRQYPQRLPQLPQTEQARFAQQQGYAQPQDLLAHLGAGMAETLRVLPYLRRDEKPPRADENDEEFNARAVQRFADRPRGEVETWYDQQRLALKQSIGQQ